MFSPSQPLKLLLKKHKKKQKQKKCVPVSKYLRPVYEARSVFCESLFVFCGTFSAIEKQWGKKKQVDHQVNINMLNKL
jgi:hypothetical protein